VDDLEILEVSGEPLTFRQKTKLILKGACADLMKEKRIWFAIGGNICSVIGIVSCTTYGSLIYKD